MAHLTERYRRVEDRTSGGIPFSYWVPDSDLPRIPDVFTGSVVYLYPDEAAARDGMDVGGSGFLTFAYVGTPAKRALYVVTNQHVALKARVVRAVRRRFIGAQFPGDSPYRDEIHFIKTPQEGWRDHPDGDDVSIFALGVYPGRLPFPAIESNSFIPHQGQAQPGDDVFFASRFMAPDGKQGDSPIVRFGHVAALPEKVYQPQRGFSQESYVVEALSLSGYSGAPVVVFALHYRGKWGGGVEVVMGEPPGDLGKTVWPPRLLGIDWGHLNHPKREPVRESGAEVQGMYVRQNAGLAGVVPAWKITELLQDEDVKSMREKDNEELDHRAEEVSLDSADDEPEFDQFEELARKVISVPKEGIDEKRADRPESG